MKAIQLHGFEGAPSLKLVDIDKPTPGPMEVLIEVKAAGINYADAEQARGRYPTFGKELPFVLGFEAAGIVRETGKEAAGVRPGDLVTAVVSSGGYAEFAVASGNAVIPIPKNLSFNEATTIPMHGMTAYTMLKYAVMPVLPRSILVQAAAGGVGLFLVQIAKHLGIQQVIALASSEDKLALLESLGADVTINYMKPDWSDKVKQATDGRGVDAVLQMSSGAIGEESFKLAAPGGRIVMFGAQNYHDAIGTEQVRQLIWQNQTVAGFAYPALAPEQIAESLPEFLDLIEKHSIRILADHTYPLSQAAEAHEMLLSRKSVGKIVLIP
jgi:NADPH2:quinone reductase